MECRTDFLGKVGGIGEQMRVVEMESEASGCDQIKRGFELLCHEASKVPLLLTEELATLRAKAPTASDFGVQALRFVQFYKKGKFQI